MARSFGAYHRENRAIVPALYSASTSPFQPQNLLPQPFPFHSSQENIVEQSPLFDAAIIFAWHPRFDFGSRWTGPALRPTLPWQPARTKGIRPLRPPPAPAALTFA